MNELMGFDSHCHLQDEAFDPDREQVYERARAHGLGLIIPGYTMATSLAAIEWAGSHEACWALVGVHPHDAKDFTPDNVGQIKQWAEHPRVVGIGEIGLDYHYLHSPVDVQKEAFASQLQVAQDLGLPASVHSRDAEDDTVNLISQHPGQSGVLHCFTGSIDFARKILDLGWYISFAGVITFKSAHTLREVVRFVPVDRMLIETDSPYLTPVPWRGQRNEPLRVLRVAEIVAAQKNLSTKEVFDGTTSNVKALFSLISAKC